MGRALPRYRTCYLPPVVQRTHSRRVNRLVAVLVLTGSLASLGACSAKESSSPVDTLANGAPPLYPAPVARASGQPSDVVLDWMDLQSSLLQREGLGPPIATRVIGYASLALAEGVRLASPDAPALPVEGLELPEVPATDLDPAVVGAAATATVTRSLIPGLEAQRSVNLLEEQQVAAARDREPAVTDESVAFGNAVGEAVLALAAIDGYDGLPQRLADDLPAGPGAWAPTPPTFEYPLEPYWGTLRPLVVSSADCPIPAPVAYDETPGSPFWLEAMAVADAITNLTDEQLATALYWRDRPSTSYTPVGHWVRIAAGVMAADAEDPNGGAVAPSLVDAASTYAALGVAAYDTFIANWDQKYTTNVLRPITYLRDLVDPDWGAAITTPPFPTYPSGHSAGSATAATVLTGQLGERTFTDTAGEFEGYPPRTYPSFAAAAIEASNSRLYGGIHFPMDLTAGELQGACVGSLVLERLGLSSSEA